MCLSRRDFLRLTAIGAGGLILPACGNDTSAKVISPTTASATVIPPTAAQQPISTAIATSVALNLKWSFEAFKDRLTTHSDNRYLYVESDGMPAHQMMIGIRSWQQQVPLPQSYAGNNAWSIPLKPALADKPISAKTALYRGAIALAANGIPIFNALNNRGEDSHAIGELDQWGGHCGRADDYHYHVAPLHLQDVVGKNNPIAYALDGFPIYGSTEPDGSAVKNLDEFNGHFDPAGNYHYHGTDNYPYINGGLRGVVEVRDDQIEPQPHTVPVRPSLQPLRGATITDFETLSKNSFSLAYQIDRQTYFVNYHFEGKVYTFEFVDAAGKKRVETYTQR